ncbi:MAG: FadR/GntR family transcriptional regulator [Bacteroidales bacterium]
MRLIEVFLYRELKPGDSIPKETELAIIMGVSRTVIRESLNRLKTMGLIESKKHRGNYHQEPGSICNSEQITYPQNTGRKDTDGCV